MDIKKALQKRKLRKQIQEVSSNRYDSIAIVDDELIEPDDVLRTLTTDFLELLSLPEGVEIYIEPIELWSFEVSSSDKEKIVECYEILNSEYYHLRLKEEYSKEGIVGVVGYSIRVNPSNLRDKWL